MKIELYKLPIWTIAMFKDNIANQKICICVSRLDKDYPGPDGYWCGPHIEIMPVLSHRISPVEEGWDSNSYFRTSKEEKHYSGD